MMDAIPQGVVHFDHTATRIQDHGDHVEIGFANGKAVKAGILIGVDGINSIVRKHLWGDSPKRPHNLHVIGGYTMNLPPGVNMQDSLSIVSHSKYTQGTYCKALSNGRNGYQWWVLEAWTDGKPAPANLAEYALKLASDFKSPLCDFIESTAPGNIQRWPIRDRVPLKKWSKGRITLAGDAAHPTSPYAAYGAGMGICDGYFTGQRLHRVDLADTAAVIRALEEYKACQLQHTTEQVNNAYFMGRLFHHLPFPLTYIRDWILDYTPYMQRTAAEDNPRQIAEHISVMGPGITS
ncbi:hypothetical protein F4810DRAFT_693400 [Camillea tinctor]|nr:hypothetical protein F4810DRAFT_693400 [Camillea tinctor]